MGRLKIRREKTLGCHVIVWSLCVLENGKEDWKTKEGDIGGEEEVEGGGDAHPTQPAWNKRPILWLYQQEARTSNAARLLVEHHG